MPDPSDVINGTTDIFDDSNLRIIIKLEGDIEEESAGSSSRHGQPLTESQTSESRTSVSQQDSGRFSDKDATDKVRHGQPSTEPQKTGASRSGPQLPSTCKACSSLPSPCQVCSALPASDAQSIASAGTDEYIINGRRMYIVGGPIAGRRHAAILLIHDLRGWRYPALRAIAQVLAKTLGVTVWVPDL